MTTVVLTLLLLISLEGCAPDTPASHRTPATSEIDSWLQGVEALEVSTADGRVLRRVSEPAVMRAFVSLLPRYEFDDIFDESGAAEYRVRLLGPEYSKYDHFIWFSKTHVMYIPKGAARLEPGERAKILSALGVSVE